jgi:hypothetical protein
MNHDLGWTPEVYGFAAGLLFITYTACEIPRNLLLERLGAGLWLARIMISWRIIAMTTAFVFDKYSLFVARALLGMTGAGFHVSNAEVGVLTAIPSIFAVAAGIGVGRSSDRTGERIWHIAIPAFIGALGFLLVAVAGTPLMAMIGIIAITQERWRLMPRAPNRTTCDALGGVALQDLDTDSVGTFYEGDLHAWARRPGFHQEFDALASEIGRRGVKVGDAQTNVFDANERRGRRCRRLGRNLLDEQQQSVEIDDDAQSGTHFDPILDRRIEQRDIGGCRGFWIGTPQMQMVVSEAHDHHLSPGSNPNSHRADQRMISLAHIAMCSNLASGCAGGVITSRRQVHLRAPADRPIADDRNDEPVDHSEGGRLGRGCDPTDNAADNDDWDQQGRDCSRDAAESLAKLERRSFLSTRTASEFRPIRAVRRGRPCWRAHAGRRCRSANAGCAVDAWPAVPPLATFIGLCQHL